MPNARPFLIVALAGLSAFLLVGMCGNSWAGTEPERKLVELEKAVLWRLESGQDTPGAGYLLATEVGLVALDPREDDPVPEDETGDVVMIVSSYPVAEEELPHGDIPLVEPGTMDSESIYELGQEKLHAIPVPGPHGDKVLILWAARRGLVLAPALLAPRSDPRPIDPES